MSDEVQVGGVSYMSSKRAAQISGYAQDYIGQLCRAGHIEAQRIGGLWYVELDSLYKHKQKADSYIPVAPRREPTRNPDSLVSFEGKDYVSASRAAELTGYHKDYVGQLARDGALPSRQVGNRWFIEREALLTHKRTKDALLGAVQSQSVGIIPPPMSQPSPSAIPPNHELLTYTSDNADLMPVLDDSAGDEKAETELSEEASRGEQLKEQPVISASRDEIEPDAGPISVLPVAPRVVPIRVLRPTDYTRMLEHKPAVKPVKRTAVPMLRRKTIFYGTSAAAAATIVVTLMFGYTSIRESASYAKVGAPVQLTTERLTASVATAAESIGKFLEGIITRELVYLRSDH